MLIFKINGSLQTKGFHVAQYWSAGSQILAPLDLRHWTEWRWVNQICLCSWPAGGQILAPLNLQWLSGQNETGPTTHCNVVGPPVAKSSSGIVEHTLGHWTKLLSKFGPTTNCNVGPETWCYLTMITSVCCQCGQICECPASDLSVVYWYGCRGQVRSTMHICLHVYHKCVFMSLWCSTHDGEVYHIICTVRINSNSQSPTTKHI